MRLEKVFRFEASHQLPYHKGKCARLHGHSWVLRVFLEDDVNQLTGMVVDYYDIKTEMEPIIDRLDHRHLNDIIWNPTSENIVTHIAMWVEQDTNLPWSALMIEETCTSSAYLKRKEVYPNGKAKDARENGEEEAQEAEEVTFVDDDIPF